MKDVEFVGLERVDPEALLAVMNEEALRRHLVDHAYFDASSISEWVREKRALDALPGCRCFTFEVPLSPLWPETDAMGFN